ncbi:hypothetical protein BDM02DRAFT_3121298 [Thelephora ganbajun]|uniref:Uncharacterized protein n=1 Tax=Thelephora ganbajun TaxID=370292 RepID=A0ACB6Z613_THEGA|nr:hypothetical protein BDM02DRAFT_3121298 [Thelephora ganbajun]
MSNPYQVHLPPEILDYIVDFLRDQPETLKQCCLVSKSWVSRTRKHLFANIEFPIADDLETWKEIFIDPSGSPAHHTRTLRIDCVGAVKEEDAEEDGWIPTFSCVTRLWLVLDRDSVSRYNHAISSTPLHKFSSSLKSLRVSASVLPYSWVWNLVRSLSLLEDLALIGPDSYEQWDSQPAAYPSVSPAFTGTLELDLFAMEGITRRLLDLPNGLHFRKFTFSWRRKDDIRWMEELMVACSDTLESLDVTHYVFDYMGPGLIDLSKAPKLRDAILRPRLLNVAWVTIALQTISPKHRDLRQVSIGVHCDLLVVADANIGKTIRGQWMNLDRILVQLWESHGIRPKVVCSVTEEEKEGEEAMHEYIGSLFPEITRRGIIEPVEFVQICWYHQIY